MLDVDNDRSDTTFVSQIEVQWYSLLPPLTLAITELADLGDDDEIILDLTAPPRR